MRKKEKFYGDTPGVVGGGEKTKEERRERKIVKTRNDETKEYKRKII